MHEKTVFIYTVPHKIVTLSQFQSLFFDKMCPPLPIVHKVPHLAPCPFHFLAGTLYPAELQLNKANTSDKQTSFFDLNLKVIGSDIHSTVYDKRDDFGFPVVNFPWMRGDVPRLPSHGIYNSQLVRFAGCCTSVLDFHFKNLQITSKLLTHG